MDEEGSTVLGGQAEEIAEAMESRFSTEMDSAAAIRLGAAVLAGPDTVLSADQLEVALLDRTRARRAFRRIKGGELVAILEAVRSRPSSAQPLPVAQRADDDAAAPTTTSSASRHPPEPARSRDARPVPASHQSVGAAKRGVDLVGEEHVARRRRAGPRARRRRPGPCRRR